MDCCGCRESKESLVVSHGSCPSLARLLPVWWSAGRAARVQRRECGQSFAARCQNAGDDVTQVWPHWQTPPCAGSTFCRCRRNILALRRFFSLWARASKTWCLKRKEAACSVKLRSPSFGRPSREKRSLCDLTTASPNQSHSRRQHQKRPPRCLGSVLPRSRSSRRQCVRQLKRARWFRKRDKY